MFPIKIIDILIDLFSRSRPDKFFCFPSMEDLDNEGSALVSSSVLLARKQRDCFRFLTTVVSPNPNFSFSGFYCPVQFEDIRDKFQSSKSLDWNLWNYLVVAWDFLLLL